MQSIAYRNGRRSGSRSADHSREQAEKSGDAKSPAAPLAIVFRPRPGARHPVLRRVADADLDPAQLSHPGRLVRLPLAVGYGLGAAAQWLYAYLQLPAPRGRAVRYAKLAAAVLCGSVLATFLWQAAEWQNSIRRVMEMPPVETKHPLEVGLIALLTFLVLIGLGRLFGLAVRGVAASVGRIVPRRLANVIGFAVAVLVFWSVANGVIFRFALHLANSSFREFDALIEPERQPPSDLLKTGSTASLIGWDDLGRAGREYIVSGPGQAEIATFTGKSAKEPVRVYVGLNAAPTTAERAELALAELKRTGAFERAVLIVVMPTGTGWIDPAAMDGVEYLLHGDVASVALQYSYLTSWLSLLSSPSTAARLHATFSPRSTAIGRRCPRITVRAFICMASASAR